MKNLYCFLFCLAFAKAVSAQQDPQYTQYIYNPTIINPAYAGSRESLSFTALSRAQWVGLEGAPVTQSVTAHTPIGDRGIGLGLSVFNDQIGPSRETFGALDLSYSLQFDTDAVLAFGLKAGAQILDVNFQRTNIFDQTDTALQENVDNQLAPVLGFGFFYYQSNWYAGLSTPNLLKTEHFGQDNLSVNGRFVAEEEIHLYATGGYVFDLSENIDFKPATIVKYVTEAPLQIDVTANLLFYDRFTIGAAYRWDAAVSGLAAFQINNNFLVGFAYDREVTDLGNTQFNSGSYEVFLRYEIFKNPRVMESPRFF